MDGRSAVVLKGKRRPSIKEGDVVVFVTGSSDEDRFSWVATVSERQEIPKPGEETTATRFELMNHAELPMDSDIGQLRYSLGFVWNTHQPRRHFRRGYRAIGEQDFETLTVGVPFVARTAYYELLGALPDVMRAEFEALEVINAASTRESDSFASRLERLRVFLKARVVAAGRLILEIHESIQALALDVSEHLLFDETEERHRWVISDNISVQAERAKLLDGEWKYDGQVGAEAEDAIAQLLAEGGDESSQGRFESIFRGVR